MGTFNTLSFHVAIDVRAGIDGGLGNTGHRDGTTLTVVGSYPTHQAVGVLRKRQDPCLSSALPYHLAVT